MKAKDIICGLFIFAFLSVTSVSRSQILISLLLGDKLNDDNIEFGITAGINRTNLPGLDQAKGISNFNMGFYFDIRLKNNLFAHTGVLVVSDMGAKNIGVYSLNNSFLDTLFRNGNLHRKINYFNVPLEVKYRKNKLFIDGGIMLSLMHGARDVFYQEIKDKDDLTYELDISEQIRSIDAGIIGGFGYKLSPEGPGMSFGLKYYYGLTDIFKDERQSGNTSLYLYTHIPIGAREKNE